VLEPRRATQVVARDVAAGTTTVTVDFDLGRFRIDDIDLEYGSWRREVFRVGWEDPADARGEVTYRFLYRRGDWCVRTETRTVLTHTPAEFVIHADLDAYEGEARVFSRSLETRIPRDLA
jgi:hypothetical protein